MPSESPNRKMAIPLWVQIVLSIIIAGLISLHMVYPELPIDAITVSLLGLLLVVWLLPFVESFKMPGGAEVRIRSMVENAEASLAEVKIPSRRSPSPTPEEVDPYSEGRALRYELIDRNPHLALAGMRIELEKRLRRIASFHKVIFPRKVGSGQLLRSLVRIEALDPNLGNMLTEIIAIGNAAVHAEDLNLTTAGRALDLGELAISALDGVIEEYEVTAKNLNP